MKSLGNWLAFILLGLFGALVAAMALVPDALATRLYTGSGWTWLLALSVALFVLQLVMVVLFAMIRRDGENA